MRDNHVKLHRRAPGLYEATVRPRGVSREPFVLTVTGPDQHYAAEPGYRWVVESDTERFFSTFKEARDYVDRFVIGKASQVDYLAARNWKGITP